MKRTRRKAWLALLSGICLMVTPVFGQDSVDFTEPGEVSEALLDPVNNDASTNSVVALFMQIDLEGDALTARNQRMTRVPVSQADFGQDPSKIIFTAFDPNRVLVGRTAVADRRMVARDGRTIVLENRTVPVIIPLLSRPQMIEILVPGNPDEIEVNVESVVGDFCDTFANDPFCSAGSPDASPHFELLRPPDP